MVTEARNIYIVITKTSVIVKVVEAVITVAIEPNRFICFKSFILVQVKRARSSVFQ